MIKGKIIKEKKGDKRDGRGLETHVLTAPVDIPRGTAVYRCGTRWPSSDTLGTTRDGMPGR